MMFDLIFDRNSKLVKAFEVAGLLMFVYVFAVGKVSRMCGASLFFFSLYALFYLVVRAFGSWDIYASKLAIFGQPDLGIMVHFKKMLVVGTYCIFFTNLFIALDMTSFAMYPSIVLMGVAIYVNLMMLYLHIKDKETARPNLFSRS